MLDKEVERLTAMYQLIFVGAYAKIANFFTTKDVMMPT